MSYSPVKVRHFSADSDSSGEVFRADHVGRSSCTRRYPISADPVPRVSKRSLTPVFFKDVIKWTFTVLGVIASASAISLF